MSDTAMSTRCTDAVLMIRPACFGANPLTAASNRFQQPGAGAEISAAAQHEFDGLARRLGDAGVRVLVCEDEPEPRRPDACFPNNWVSFHADGTAVLYPMMAENRRLERRPEVLSQVEAAGFGLRRRLDLSHWESRGEFLEGTGSLVLDRALRIAYACRSPRTSAAPLAQFAAAMDYQVVEFAAYGTAGEPAYHTNVLMCVGEGFALLCTEALAEADRDRVRATLAAGADELVEIGRVQMGAFAGNMLALRSQRGEPVIAMSEAALASLEPAQRRRLEAHGSVLAAPIPVIEKHGGGSVRCMLAELFLPH